MVGDMSRLWAEASPWGAILGTTILLCCGCGEAAKGDPSAAGPSSTDAETGPDLSVALFDPDHLIEVEIDLDPEDWDTVRQEGRDLLDALTGCSLDYAYTYVHATVTVDGESYDDVAVRKKGFLGSLSTARPSLKVNFGKFVDGRRHADMKRLTLNNNRQDLSNLRQCLAYGLFSKAGSVASRCNFAHVVVNGEDLGIYSNVESVKKPMLRRHFDDDSGNLYEGQGADFIDTLVDRMELKTNEFENDRSDLDAVVAALQVDDARLFEELGKVIDLDAFMTFWAMEVMVGHWDSYTGGQNNYLTYHDPTSDRFFFIPWGTDGAFTGVDDIGSQPHDVSVLATGAIANRLYRHAEGRAMYFERLKLLSDEVWNEDELLAEVDRIEALTDPPTAAVQDTRDFILQQGAALRSELGAIENAKDWIDGPGAEGVPTCRADARTPFSGTFSTTWGSDAPESGGNTANLSLDGQPWQPDPLLALAGLSETDPHRAEIVLLNPLANGRFRLLLLALPKVYFNVGQHPMHGMETQLLLIELGEEPTVDFELIGFGGGGTITLDAASMEPGGRVEGSFEGSFVQFSPN